MNTNYEIKTNELKQAIKEYLAELDLVKQDFNFTAHDAGRIERTEYLANELLSCELDNVVTVLNDRYAE